jgi:hypothetical protein
MRLFFPAAEFDSDTAGTARCRRGDAMDREALQNWQGYLRV